jgi:hypothetical protein
VASSKPSIRTDAAARIANVRGGGLTTARLEPAVRASVFFFHQEGGRTISRQDYRVGRLGQSIWATRAALGATGKKVGTGTVAAGSRLGKSPRK